MTLSENRPNSPIATLVGVLGVLFYAMVGFIYLSSGLVVPLAWYYLLLAIWLAGTYPLYRVFNSRRLWTPLVAVAAVVLLYAIVILGGIVFNWTA